MGRKNKHTRFKCEKKVLKFALRVGDDLSCVPCVYDDYLGVLKCFYISPKTAF